MLGEARPVTRWDGGISRKMARYLVTKPVRARNARPLVSLTFDDVPETALTVGAGVLEQHGVRGTFYIAGGLCGTVDQERPIISAQQCRELHQRGHEIGCHTYSHPVVQRLSADDFGEELERNKQFFKAIIPEQKLENFCFPYGITSFARKQQAQRLFRSCRGTHAGVNAGVIDLGLLKATGIYHKSTEATISTAVQEAVRLNGWLILFTHDVSPDPSWIGCTPELLGSAVRAALDHGCEVVTVHDGLERIGTG